MIRFICGIAVVAVVAAACENVRFIAMPCTGEIRQVDEDKGTVLIECFDGTNNAYLFNHLRIGKEDSCDEVLKGKGAVIRRGDPILKLGAEFSRLAVSR